MAKENKHIFDILGIGAREDSYTDLIVFSFNNDDLFKNSLLEFLGESQKEEWIIEARYPVPITGMKGRKKGIPDIVIYCRKLNKIIASCTNSNTK